MSTGSIQQASLPLKSCSRVFRASVVVALPRPCCRTAVILNSREARCGRVQWAHEGCRVEMASRISLYLFLAAVALAPLPLASVEVVWVSVWASVLGLSLALSPTGQLRGVHLRLLAQ